MKVRIVALVAPLLGALLLSAAAADEKEQPKAKIYKTPQEVFDAFVPALYKRDARTFVGCLAPDVIKRLAGDYARRGVQRRIIAETGGKDGGKNEKVLKLWQGTFDVLDKHGLTARATKAVKLTDKDRAEAALVKLLKDPAAFLVDYQEALDKLDSGKPKEKEPKAKLSDVKIDGDKATGTITIKYDGGEEKRPVAFSKVGGGWKIDPFADDKGKDAKEKDKAAKDK
jgi:hypothetical protein